MDSYEQLPVLLGFEFEGDKIKIRLDSAGLGNFDLRKNSIEEITLQGCKPEIKLVKAFEELISEVFEYEIYEWQDKTIFQFYGDYGKIRDKIECEVVTKKFYEFTMKDLALKGTTLFNLYTDLYKKFENNSAANFRLREKLEFEINNQIERSQRKKEFFAEKDRGKSEAFKSEIKFLQKLHKLITGNFDS